jgi:hypothetical protein
MSMMLTVIHLLSEPGWTEQWLESTAILALLLEPHAVAIVIHHLQLGMFENVLPRTAAGANA